MKYIDAKRLKCELEKRLKNVRDYMNGAGMKYKGPKYYKAQGKESAYDALLSVIDSLQQEQPDFPTTDEQIKDFLATHPKIKVPEKYKNPDWLLNKQEQPEVDLDELINDFLLNNSEFLVERDSKAVVQKLARHFYKLGKNARKEES